MLPASVRHQLSDEAEEASEAGRFTEPAALFEAAQALGGRPDTWVNHGLVGDEYWASWTTRTTWT